ncbi:hypothetical protein M8J76_006028 [Diaphorina citri]|nr:hypothetical protein M8J76_006028 [Diaphorina citri]
MAKFFVSIHNCKSHLIFFHEKCRDPRHSSGMMVDGTNLPKPQASSTSNETNGEINEDLLSNSQRYPLNEDLLSNTQRHPLNEDLLSNTQRHSSYTVHQSDSDRHLRNRNTIRRSDTQELYREKKLKCMKFLKERLKNTLETEEEFRKSVQRFRDKSKPSPHFCFLVIGILLVITMSTLVVYNLGYYIGLSYASIHMKCTSYLAWFYRACHTQVL